MRTEQMKYLLEVAACGSISAAAKKLYINQTTLSAAIQAIESELGSNLFRRTPKGVVLTSYGEVAIPKLREISDLYDALLQLDTSGADIPQQVDVCIYSCACHFWSLYLTNALRQAELNTLLTIHESSGNQVCAQILDGKASIGIGACFPSRLKTLLTQAEKNNLVLESLYQDSSCAYVGKDSPLAGREFVTMEDLKDEHLALSTCCLERFYAGKISDIVTQISVFSGIETAKDAVRHSGMACILPRVATEARPESDMVGIPLKTSDPNTNSQITYIIHPRPEDMNPAEQVVVDTVKQWCGEHHL